MDAFSAREKALEAKFQHEQMLEYKILSRRNRLFGLWLAELLDMNHDDAEGCARDMVGGHYITQDGQHVIQKALALFSDRKISVSEHRLRKQLGYCYEDASVQILNE